MERVRTLQGGCACGRNAYIVQVPASSIDQLQVLFDNSSVTRRHTTSPFTPFLRVPLDWYHSMTYAFFPDETHRSIRRTFASPFDGPQAQRQFCGFCGTQLSSWNEQTPEEARHIHISLGSLIDEDVRRIESWGLLRTADDDDDEYEDDDDLVGGEVMDIASAPQQSSIARQLVSGMTHKGSPWFEEMVQDSRLGKLRRQRGGYESADGSQTVHWEIVEIGPDGNEVPAETTTSSNGKRKRGEEGANLQEQTDVRMRG